MSKHIITRQKGTKGITLIALIITIIVLLILAGVAIATLTGENGILTQAKNAKKEMTKAEAKERIQLEVLGSYDTDGEINIATLKSNIAKNISEAVIGEETELPLTVTVGDYTFIVNANGTVEEATEGGNDSLVGKIVEGENMPYTNNGTAIIPVGFMIVPGCEDVSEGLVISDDPDDTEDDSDNIVAEGNQFVWVPVSKENFATEFVRHDFGNQNIADDMFVSGQPMTVKIAELVGDGINVDTNASESEQEAQKMYKSVKENGGFYIGRYETGELTEYAITETESGSTTTIQTKTRVIRKGADPYDGIKWGNGMKDETGGAVEIARGFAGENDYESVTSTLVYGVQWDAVMRWISRDENLKGYLKDSSSVGNYSDRYKTAKTGAVREYQLKNIYDMAGNVAEWTMESYDTVHRIYRGGSCGSNGTSKPISHRNDNSWAADSEGIGFRVALYL